jgi:D-alanine-D-alanine ligase-like ATP-grasp enzyme
MSKIYIMHENLQWFAPLAEIFDAHGLPYQSWDMSAGSVDLSAVPPEGVFFSKMSASSYLRGNAHAPDNAFMVMAWLQAHGRKVVNGPEVLRLELSKMEQYIALQTAGIAVPRAVACFGAAEILGAAKGFDAPFIIKPNRGGKGDGVKLIESHAELEAYIKSEEYQPSVDNITLVQEYIKAPKSCVTRMEFIGAKLVYAVRVDTRAGFELCPAEACAIDASYEMFTIVPDFTDPLVDQLEAFLDVQHIDVAGIEFIEDTEGKKWVYDINTNTNYNPDAEARAGISAIPALVEFLKSQLI